MQGFRAAAISAKIPRLDHPVTTLQLLPQTLLELSIRKCLHLQFSFIKSFEVLPLSTLILTELSRLAPTSCFSLAVAYEADISPHLSSLHHSTQKLP